MLQSKRSILLVIILSALLLNMASAATEKVLYSFAGSDGSAPWAALIFDKSGNLYGTTYQGGAFGYGTVFELTPNTGGAWTEKVLHSFNSNGEDGAGPGASLVFDREGNLHGTTIYGGNGPCTSGQYPGCGIAFELSPNSDGSWSEQILHSFKAGTDGAFPASPLIIGPKGSLYGTTSSGGTGDCSTGGYVGCGTAFVLIREKSGLWGTLSYSFNGSDQGEFPYGPLVMDASGNVYGTTEEGGSSCPGGVTCGLVFKFSHLKGKIVNTIVYDFLGSGDGQWPVGPLAFDTVGNLHGVTIEGGGNDPNCLYGCGTVFELSPNSEGWTERVLHSFAGGGDGLSPQGGVIEDRVGNLYGTTELGGTGGGWGTVFKLDSEDQQTILYSFTGGSDGGDPYAGLASDGSHLYGVTLLGGMNGHGVVFEIMP